MLFWVAGFDIIYACQDADFDRQAKLHSIPASIGVSAALWLALFCHALMVAMLVVLYLLASAPNGPLGMVSPANTYVGLTHTGPGTAAGEPDKYYPSGTRNYIRIVAADDFQGAADALLAKQLGAKKVFILNYKEA